MAFYDEMRDLAVELLTEFGNDFQLQKPDSKPTYDPVTRKNITTYKNYTGKCVMKPYTAEMIGMLQNIIKAGDVEFKCTMDDISVIPTEGKDKIIFGGNTYNVLSVSTINPSGSTVVVHTLQARRASN